MPIEVEGRYLASPVIRPEENKVLNEVFACPACSFVRILILTKFHLLPSTPTYTWNIKSDIPPAVPDICTGVYLKTFMFPFGELTHKEKVTSRGSSTFYMIFSSQLTIASTLLRSKILQFYTPKLLHFSLKCCLVNLLSL